MGRVSEVTDRQTMKALEKEDQMSEFPRVKAVSAGPNFTLNIEWKDGTRGKANLTGLIHSSENFKTFADNPAEFRAVKPVAWGDGIEWANGLDYSANTLRELSEEQKPMSGAELRKFAQAKGLHNEEMAKLLNCTVKTVRSYYEARQLESWIAILVRCFERDDTVFAAHYRPVEINPRGRPKSALKH
jgi:hypothetical protein